MRHRLVYSVAACASLLLIAGAGCSSNPTPAAEAPTKNSAKAPPVAGGTQTDTSIAGVSFSYASDWVKAPEAADFGIQGIALGPYDATKTGPYENYFVVAEAPLNGQSVDAVYAALIKKQTFAKEPEGTVSVGPLTGQKFVTSDPDGATRAVVVKSKTHVYAIDDMRIDNNGDADFAKFLATFKFE